MTLDGQVVIVSGAAAGIGAATARLLAARGARLALVDLDERAAGALAGELGAFFRPCDVTRADQVEAAVVAARAHFGRIDGLVNNAGGPAGKRPLWELDEGAWDATFSLNVKSAFLLARAVLPAMLERRSGSVVNLTSDQAFQPTPGRAAYAAAKAAIVGLTRALARDSGPHGVRVNAVAPGPTLTEKTRQIADDQALAALAARHPTRRLAAPEDVAEAIAFLLSEGSRHVTGQVLHVNGGLVLG